MPHYFKYRKIQKNKQNFAEKIKNKTPGNVNSRHIVKQTGHKRVIKSLMAAMQKRMQNENAMNTQTTR